MFREKSWVKLLTMEKNVILLEQFFTKIVISMINSDETPFLEEAGALKVLRQLNYINHLDKRAEGTLTLGSGSECQIKSAKLACREC